MEFNPESLVLFMYVSLFYGPRSSTSSSPDGSRHLLFSFRV